MKIVFLIFTMILSISTFAGFEGKQDGVSLKIFNKIDCTTGLACSRVGDGNFTIATSVEAVAEGENLSREAVFDYDFAVDGGGIGAITTGVNLPANAVIEKCFFRVETQLVDAGSGTHAWSCEDADNILTAADQSGVAAGAFLAANSVGTAATMVDSIAASCDITFTIGGAALTAGKMRGWCRYSVHP